MLEHTIFSLLLFRASLLVLKNLRISFTSLSDLARIGGDNLSILTSLSIFFSPFFLIMMELVLGVNLCDIFCLKEFLFLSAKSKSRPKLQKADKNIQAALPIPLSSIMSLDLLTSMFLLPMYLAMQVKDFLIYLESERKCSNKL